MLRNGQTAPIFSLPSDLGKEFSNSTVKEPYILFFFRGKFCPTTDKFLASYQDFDGRLEELGFRVIGISADEKEDLLKLRSNLRVRFPLLTDKNCTVAKQYGVYINEGGPYGDYPEPALFIVDVDGNIAYFTISSGPKGLPSPGDIVPVLLYMKNHGGRY